MKTWDTWCIRYWDHDPPRVNDCYGNCKFINVKARTETEARRKAKVQIVGYRPRIEEKYALPEGEALDFNPIGVCESIVEDMPNCPDIIHGGNRAYYRPSTDEVGMPKHEQFKTEGDYYLTLFHELAHSTMHVTRLDRKQDRDSKPRSINTLTKS